jgi:hypothetical protein
MILGWSDEPPHDMARSFASQEFARGVDMRKVAKTYLLLPYIPYIYGMIWQHGDGLNKIAEFVFNRPS